MSYVLIIGAKSDIAKSCAREYAKQGYDLYLAGREINQLKGFAKDIEIRTSQQIQLLEFDVLNTSSHQGLYNNLAIKPFGVITAVGLLGDQKHSQEDFNQASTIINTNFTGIVSILNLVANDFEKRKSGFIVGISSVAGDRGRKSNYFYGAAKAGFTAYLSGLRNRLVSSHVHVMTVKPGFVATTMTKDMDLPEKLTSQPKAIAEHIYKAQQKNKDIIYSKWQWRYIMFIIKSIPEFIFKKLDL